MQLVPGKPPWWPRCMEGVRLRNAAPRRALRARWGFALHPRQSLRLSLEKKTRKHLLLPAAGASTANGQTDKDSCIPAYRTHRPAKRCSGIKLSLKKNEWCFVAWLNGLDMPWMRYLGIFKEADGHILEGVGFFSFKLAHHLNMLKLCTYNWLKLSSSVGLKYNGIRKGFLQNCRYACGILL